MLQLDQLIAAAYGFGSNDDVWNRGPACKLAQNLLHLSVARLATFVEFNQCVRHASRIQRALAVGGVGSVGFAEHKAPFCGVMLVDLRQDGRQFFAIRPESE